MDNRTFVESAAGRTVSIVGNPTQCSRSPIAQVVGEAYTTAQKGASVYLDGSSYLSIPYNSDLNPGTGDFTIEFAIYPTANPSSAGEIFYSSTFSVYRGNNGSLNFGNDGAGYFSFPAGSAPLNAWTHVVICRTAGTIRYFLNGSLVSSSANTANYTLNSGAPLLIGSGYVISGWGFIGFLSGFRWTIGSGLYTANFTPNYIPTVVTNTKILLSFSNIGIHDATTRSPLILMGNVARASNFSKYGSGSILFPGAGGDYAMVPSGVNSLLQMGTGNFTLEGWVYPTGGAGGYRTICGIGSSSAYAKVYATNTNFWGISINDSTIQASTTAFTLNTWTHFALVRYNSVYYLYVNGTLATSTSGLGTQNYTSSLVIIGGHMNPPTSQPYMGYLDDFRVTKYARYTASFTPPTAALPTF